MDAGSLIDEQKKAPLRLWITKNPKVDTPTEQDSLGFEVYTNALAAFLIDENTVPPITMSVEGGWGSGKSSLMLQIEGKIKATAAEKKLWNHKTMRFNAWQNDKAESLWATFALTFIDELSSKMRFRERISAKAKLTWYRFNLENGFLAVVQALGIVSAVFGLLAAGILKHTQIFSFVEHFTSSHDTATDVGLVGALGAIVAAIRPLASRLTKMFANPVIKELKNYVESPDYRSNVNFINQFKTDFSKIIKSYVGSNGRVYVFIDDLDRCDVPGAANLAEALNLLLSASGKNLIFVIGLDRDIVAAGLSAKYASILPYLDAFGDVYNGGRKRNEYGQAFLEKFIQVPFRVPRPTRKAINDWLANVNQRPKGDEGNSAISKKAERYLVKLGNERQEFLDIINEFVELLEYNPRKITVFMNVLRLQLIVAYETGLLDDVDPKQIAFFMAIITNWPHISESLFRNKWLLKELADQVSGSSENSEYSYWSKRPTLMKFLLKYRDDVSNFDISPLTSILPKVKALSWEIDKESRLKHENTHESDGHIKS